MSAGRCASCGADVFWAITPAGKRMPVDPNPVPDGNVAIYRDHLGALRARVLRAGEQPSAYERRGVAHFATCPHADRHRTRTTTGPAGEPVTVPGNVVTLAELRRRRERR